MGLHFERLTGNLYLLALKSVGVFTAASNKVELDVNLLEENKMANISKDAAGEI